MNKKYEITIIERLTKVFSVEAKNENEALEIVKSRYKSAEVEYVLSGDNYFDTEFEVQIEE